MLTGIFILSILDLWIENQKESIMKKFLLIMAAVLLLTASAVCAQETATVTEVNWSDIEQTVLENDLGGGFYSVGELGIKMWIPDVLTETELSEEDIENGYLSYLTTQEEDAVAAITATDLDGVSLKDYAKLLEGEDGVKEIEYVLLNGIEAVSYDMPENDTMTVSFGTDTGYIVEFTFWPMSDEGFAAVAALMAASIQAE